MENKVDTQEIKKEIKIRPTVFIGLGGTGKEVLLRIRRRILNEDWNGKRLRDLSEFPIASFLYFDLDTAEGRESDKSVKADPLSHLVAFQPTETLQKRVNLSEYTNELDRYPLIKEWWPKASVDRVVKEANKGAGQIRPISRLQFFALAKELRDNIRTKAHAVTESVNKDAALKTLGLQMQKDALRIVIVTSTAGGTGSGSFLDLGYLARSVYPEEKVNVDLILLLAGGYESANKERVFANTYAALKELEYCMRGNRYVEKWAEFDIPVGEKPPYNEVYLIDNTNAVGESTRNLEDIYGMLADTLFEDLSNGEFADQKRSVAVNQQQHKTGGYRPYLGTMSEKQLYYERIYSSLGQTTIDTQARASMDIAVNKACIEMIKAFFQVAGDEKANIPTPEKLSEFTRSNLSLGKTVYEDFPKDLSKKQMPIQECALVDDLLRITGIGSLLVQVEDNMKNDFNKITQDYSDRKDWLQGVEDVKTKREREISGDPGSPDAALREKQIIDRADKTFKEWTQEDGLKEIFYQLLDDKERGGLDYTIALIEQIKDSIDNNSTGIIKTLRAAQTRYLELASVMWKERYLPSLERLKETFGFDPLGTKKKYAEVILSQISGDLSCRLKYLLREIACRQAIKILTDLSKFLGEKEGLDERGETIWNGLVREFLDGKNTVKKTVALLDEENRRLQVSCNRTDGMYIVLKDKEEMHSIDFDISQATEWASEAFKGYGGSRELFVQLKDKKGQYQVISQLSGFADQRISKNKEAELSFVNAFKKLPRNEQKEILKKVLSRAMPWLDMEIKGQFSSSFTPSQYKCLIAVNEKNKFKEIFDTLKGEIAPGGVTPDLYESSVKGRLVCYIELSGIPLDVIKPLRMEWKSEYSRITTEGLPLHNHKDWTRFPDPLVPSTQEIEGMIETMQLFLEGSALCVFRRKKGEDGYYEVQTEPGRWQGVGNERRIRSLGFNPHHKEVVEQHLREIKTKINSPCQMLALKVLFNQTAENAYTPKEDLDATGLGQKIKGFASMQAEELAKVCDEWFKRHSTHLDQPSLENRLIESLPEWTVEIQDSKNDLDPAEVDVKIAASKRAVKPEFFKTGWLENLVNVEAEVEEKKQKETKVQSKEAAASFGDSQSSFDPVKRLKEIKELFDMEILSKEEYEQERKELLKLLRPN
ncbi:MAG: tubulin-like doman-containing protein [bacterium]|nr:tubulin-like doman-containing protein [bacterium]